MPHVAEYSSTAVEPFTPATSHGKPVSLQDIIISQELLRRPLRRVNRRGEIAGMHALANAFTQGPAIVLKHLAHLAVELCVAGSAGVSLIEGGENSTQVFRWQALAGELEPHEGGTTPRDWSPCGECLKAGKPILYSYPARYFTYFQKIDTPIVEGLVIPMYLDGLAVGTIWIISHNAARFDAEDVRIMTSLGTFAASAQRFAYRPGAAHRAVQSSGGAAIEGSLVWGEYIRRIARGDHFALAALMEETKPVVFSTALKILGFLEDADEVTSDVYTSVWRMAQHYDIQRGTACAWLLGIARNRAIDYLRMRSARVHSEVALAQAAFSIKCNRSVNPENSAEMAQ